MRLSDRLAVEIPSRKDVVLEDQRIVRSRIQLDRADAGGVLYCVMYRAENLRCAPETIGVLHACVVFAVRFPDLTVHQQVSEKAGGLELTSVGADPVDSLIERCRRASQRLETHGSGAVRSAPQIPRIVHSERE
jgi:hypothetical protein